MNVARTRPPPAHSASETGPRERNEDRLGIWTERPVPVVAVADGMGGYQAGDVAARLAIEAVDKGGLPPSTPEAVQGWMEALFKDAETRIQRHAQVHGTAGMGSTLVVACLLPDSIAIGHVGDSRAYLVKPSGASVLTRDHSVGVDALERGLVEPEAVHTIPHHGALLKSLGALGSDVPEVTTLSRPGSQENALLLLCTDGVWNVVAEAELPGLLFGPAGKPVEGPAAALVQEALDRGTQDNATAVVLPVRPEPATHRSARLLSGVGVALLAALGIGWWTMNLNPSPSAEPQAGAEATPAVPSVAREASARIVWIQAASMTEVEASVGGSAVSRIPPGTEAPLRLIAGDSLLLRWGEGRAADSMLVVVQSSTSDTIQVPPPEGGQTP